MRLFPFYKKYKNVLTFGFLLMMMGLFTPPSSPTFAQKQTDTSGKLPIEILEGNNTTLVFIQTDSGGINKLINNVSLKQGDTYMYCDSAYINRDKNTMQAFGSVRIVQAGGTEVQSDYLRYTGNNKLAYLHGNVRLTDGKNNLWTEELEYNVGTKVGTYTQGGTLQSDATTLSSNLGVYNVRSKDARFTEEVIVTDPEYTVTATDLGYNTETKMVTFFGPSIVISDKSELRTSSGTWDAKNEIAHFTSRSSVQNGAQYIEADRMDYNKKTGFGEAVGKVVAIDTAQKTTLYCGYSQYNQITRKSLATINPVMKKMNGADSLFIRADTFYTAPIQRAQQVSLPTKSPKNIAEENGNNPIGNYVVVNESKSNNNDTAKGNRQAKKGKNAKGYIENKKATPNTIERTLVKADTTNLDTTAPRYFTGYHHVIVFSDSLQAVCDSIVYSEADSIMRMMYNPIAWSRNSQLTGDTILLCMDSNKLKKLFIPNNALIVAQSGPEQAQMYDQVQGKTLTGYFVNNNIERMVVWPNVESIHYAKDEAQAYLGVSQATSDRMKVFFAGNELSKIVLEQDVKQTMTPLQQADIPSLRLSRFRWLKDKRPLSVDELFNYGKPINKDNSTPPKTAIKPVEAKQQKSRRRGGE